MLQLFLFRTRYVPNWYFIIHNDFNWWHIFVLNILLYVIFSKKNIVSISSFLQILFIQISPVIPHDYQATCLPVAIFYWKVISWNNEDLRVTITFSWHGPNPRKRSKSSDVSKSENGNNSNENTANTHVSTSENASPVYSQRSTAFSAGDNVLGCLLERTIGGELPCCFGIAAKSMDKVSCPSIFFQLVKIELCILVLIFVMSCIESSIQFFSGFRLLSNQSTLYSIFRQIILINNSFRNIHYISLGTWKVFY